MLKAISAYFATTPPKFRNRATDSQDDADVVELSSFTKEPSTELQKLNSSPPPAAPSPSAHQPHHGSSIASSTAGSAQAAQAGHWRSGSGGERLIGSVLLQLASSDPQPRLERFLAASSWQDACEQCRDVLLLWALLQSYSADSALHEAPSGPEPQQQQQQPASWQRFLSAAAAAGVQLPADAGDSVAAGDPAVMLEVALAVVTAGESQQLLQDAGCMRALQQLQRQREQLGQQQQELPPPQQQQQQELQQEPQPEQSPAVAAVWPLLHAWLAAVASGGVQRQQQRQPEEGQQVEGGTAREQQNFVVLISWLQVLTSLQQQQQQQQQQDSQLTADASDAAATVPTTHDPLTTVTETSHHSPGSSSASDPPDRALLLLQQLGCCLPLLQARDLSGPAGLLDAAPPPDPLLLVQLLRLARSSQHLWLPLLQLEAQEGVKPEQGSRRCSSSTAAVPGAAERSSRGKLARSRAGAAAADGRQASSSRSGSQDGRGGSTDAGSGAGSGAASGSSSKPVSPRSSWPAELLATSLWPGEDDEADAAAITREERTLRCWINSLLHSSGGAAGAAGPPGSQPPPLQRRRSSSTGSTPVAAAAAAAEEGMCDFGELEGMVMQPGTPPSATSRAAAAAAAGSGAAGSSASAGSSRFSVRSISSLFGAEVRSGLLLLELLDALQPGCVDWRRANRPPFKGIGMAAQLQALENCQLALRVAQEDLGLPLVSMSPRDVVLGRRKIITSLVWQLMRYHTMQLLQSISAASSTAGQQQQQTSEQGGPLLPGGGSGEISGEVSSPAATPRAAAAAAGGGLLRPAGLTIRSSSKKQQRQLAISEADILRWANSKLASCASTRAQQPAEAGSSQVQGDAAAAAGPPPVIRSFKDPVLASGVVLLQLLHVLAPDAVDLSFVTPGATQEQRISNARYALSVADKIGCSLFLVWEDLVDLQPRLVLVLLASLMYLDQKNQQAAAGDSHGQQAGVAVGPL